MGFVVLILVGVLQRIALADSTAVAAADPCPTLRAVWRELWELVFNNPKTAGTLFVVVLGGIIAGSVNYVILRNKVTGIGTSLDDLKSKLESAFERFDSKIDELRRTSAKQSSGLIISRSPQTLNEKGIDFYQSSGLKQLLEENKSKLIEAVKKSAYSNEYQADLALFEAVELLMEDSTLKQSFERIIFNFGYDKATVQLVGALGIRAEIFKVLGLDPEQIDVHKEEAKS